METRRDAALIAEYARQTEPAKPGGKVRWWCYEPSRLDSLFLWHESRILGLARTAQSLLDCAEGERRKTLTCRGCDHEWSVPWTCDNTLLCPSCRKVASSRRAKQVGEQVVASVGRAAGDERLRLVTLPVPHVGQLEQRATVAFRAKPAFFRHLNEWARIETHKETHKSGEVSWEASDDVELGADSSDTAHDDGPGEASPVAENRDDSARSLAHWDALELTAGDDGEGHVHWHSLVLGGFLPQPLVAMWWANAVSRAGGEPFAEVVMWSASSESVEWIRGHCFGDTRRHATRELLRFARLPWNAEGRRPPRKGDQGPHSMGASGEPLPLYVWRRVAWAQQLADAGETVSYRSLSRVLGDYRQKADELYQGELDMLADCCDVPRLVVDVRLADSERGAVELVKYTMKDVGMTAKLQARAFIALRGRHVLQSTFSWAWKSGKENPGCPECGSSDVREQKSGGRLVDYKAVWRIIGRARRDGRLAAARPRPPPSPPPRKVWRQQNFGDALAREAV